MKRSVLTSLAFGLAVFSVPAAADLVGGEVLEFEPAEGPTMISDGASTNKVKIVRAPDGTIFTIYGDAQDVDINGNSLAWNSKRAATQKPYDIVIKHSVDEGLTWSEALNIDNTAALSSSRGILVQAGPPLLDPVTGTPDLFNDPNAVDYPGDSDKPNVFIAGNNIVVTFNSKYCPGGEQRFVVYPELYGITVPYSCQYVSRLVWNPKTKAFNNYEAWGDLPYRTDQLTTGIHDVKQDVNRANKFTWVANWQADPLGLSLGEAGGPGDGASGACVNHGTDIWYTYLPILNAEGTGPDTARFVNESWSEPIRITQNVFKNGPLEGRDVQTHPAGDYDRGNVGASRSNMGMVNDHVVMAYEETKGTQGYEDGKYVRYHAFRFDAPPVGGEHGCIISDPTENARRVRFLVQSGLKLTETFADVSSTHWAYDYIEAFVASGITRGCGDGAFCPDKHVTRAEMAVFLERGMNGGDYVPPPATGGVFDDVNADSFAANFIEQLAADGITSGCGNGNFCPKETVTKSQVAVFLLRAKYGSAYSPPAPTGIFVDVPIEHWAAAWIEQLAAEGFATECGDEMYCPYKSVYRDEMAVLTVRTLDLPMTDLPTPLLFIYKQGDYTQGGPSDIMLRRAVGGLEPESLRPQIDVENCRLSIMDGIDPIYSLRDDMHKAAMNLSGSRDIGGEPGTGQMGEEIGTAANPLENALAHRGIMRGKNILLGYSYVPDLARFLYLNNETPYNFLVRRSTDGGATWTDARNLTPAVTAESGYSVKEPRIVKTQKSGPKCAVDPTDCSDSNVIYVLYGLQTNVYDHYEEAVDVDIYMQMTLDGGVSFSAPQSLTGGDPLFGTTDAIEDSETQIRLRPDGRESYIVWTGYDGVSNNALYRKAIVYGDTQKAKAADGSNIQLTVSSDVAAGATLTGVSWQAIDGYPDVPAGYDFPYGAVNITISDLNSGGLVDVTLSFEAPLPADARYFKFGPTLDNTTDHWYAIPVTVEGNTISYTLADGATGDDDLSVNGVIVDTGAPAIAVPAPKE